MSPLVTNNGTFFSNSSGTLVFSESLNLKLVNNIASPTRTCSNPNLMPMQLRGPSPNGMNAQDGRFASFSGEKRSGSYTSGSGYSSGSWWMA